MQPATVQTTESLRPDDAGLVRRARDGDAAAFDAIAGDRLPGAFRLASAILGNEAAAADAIQNSLLAAWRQLPQLRDVERFEAWFHRILVNECRMQMRRQSREREVELASDGAHRDQLRSAPAVDTTSLDLVEVLDLLEGAFETLDHDDRALVVLHHLLDRPLDEIAATLHMPVGTVKWRLHEARKVLRGALEATR